MGDGLCNRLARAGGYCTCLGIGSAVLKWVVGKVGRSLNNRPSCHVSTGHGTLSAMPRDVV